MYRILVPVLFIALATSCAPGVPNYDAPNSEPWVDLDGDSTKDIALSIYLRSDTTIAGFLIWGRFKDVRKYKAIEFDFEELESDTMRCRLMYNNIDEMWLEGKDYGTIIPKIQAVKSIADTTKYALDCKYTFRMTSLPEEIDMRYNIIYNEQMFEGVMKFDKYETDTSSGVMRWH